MSSAAALAVELGFDAETCTRLGALWGKSRKNAGGTMNLLLSHLFDTAAVAELLWDNFLSSSTKDRLDSVSGDRGRRFFAWICGIHDCGKATPAFQVLDAVEARRVRASGLSWPASVTPKTRWRHDRAGAKLLIDHLGEVGWSEEAIDWIWPLVAGHHGLVPERGAVAGSFVRADGHGRGEAWKSVQCAVVAVFTRAQGFAEVVEVEPVVMLTRSEQLHLSGLVVMADWIASNENYFTGIDDLNAVTMASARGRAANAWRELRMHGGWGRLSTPPEDILMERFGRRARAFQRHAVERVRAMSSPGLLVIEAPMGEGKTEVALATAEIIAAAFGADGVFVGMPTQATCDPMFTRVREWVGKVGPGLEDRVVLLHGKRDFNTEWKRLLNPPQVDPDHWWDSVGEDMYGMSSHRDETAGGSGPSEWLLGRLRGLLAPVVVGTIDQLLHAATRTKHVMLRAAGLAGKVVILDEVHAADVYMSQFLHEALRWLGQARVPVILLSATLPAEQRRSLVEAYATGGRNGVRTSLPDLPRPTGYPSITTVCVEADEPEVLVTSSESWRAPEPVGVELLSVTRKKPGGQEGEGPEDLADLVALLNRRLPVEGCALIIRNDVRRAQDTYTALCKEFGEDVRLLHARLAVEPRARRTQECLDLLGEPGKGKPRPRRMILVATQLAEQSFDVDADLVVSDLAPIDLLLQRVGRLHRHQRARPTALKRPTVVVTGVTFAADGPPRFLASSEHIYGRYRLLRTADLVLGVTGTAGWTLPTVIPGLVESVYSGHDENRTRWPEDEQKSRADWEQREEARKANARPFLLSAPDEWTAPTLAGLSYAHVAGAHEQTRLDALVRDGEESVEVVVLRRDERGYRTYRNVRLGVHGEKGPELLEDVVAGTVRLPARLTQAALRELGTLPEWSRHPWLKHTRALVIPDDTTSVELGGSVVSYDDNLGLVVRQPIGVGRHR
ncbi:CRISPR-associated helicase Cas3' [Actinosynnema sp. NPDC020468]|uniref:CRISPR-associated helicase Cas3' n=1 Tax=Actinosynnema sp. NPDC020468 TaxID=3154488 RepID=UPI0033CAF18A